MENDFDTMVAFGQPGSFSGPIPIMDNGSKHIDSVSMTDGYDVSGLIEARDGSLSPDMLPYGLMPLMAKYENHGPISMAEALPTTNIDRRETMRVYMRHYRLKQKMSLDSLPDDEKRLIMQKQRERVRERVRRHRLRKKLRAAGVGSAAIEQKLHELIPLSARQDRTFGCHSAFGQRVLQGQLSMTDAICLDNANLQFPPSNNSESTGMLRNQVPGARSNAWSSIDFDTNRMASSNLNSYQMQRFGQLACQEQPRLSPISWTTQQVGIFLEGLDLGHLKLPFEAHHVDGEALMSMSNEQLDDMRIPQAIWHDILSAINSLRKVVL